MLSIAPMMDRTDRHYRYFMRGLTRKTLLYTEMLTPGAIIHGDRDHLLSFHPEEHPISLQLGTDSPEEAAEAVRIAEDWGYDEYNLNVGCPSDRVQNRNFGACLMADPARVRDVCAAMRSAGSREVTVKCRIGIQRRVGDAPSGYEDLLEFVDTVADAGVRRFTVHARVAVLEGLNPKENRMVPPLRYEVVHQLKAARPDLVIEVNGGLTSLDQARRHLEAVDGIMVGRAAYDTPAIFAAADPAFFAEHGERRSRRGVLDRMIPYVAAHAATGRHPKEVYRHMLGLFAGRAGARLYRRRLGSSMPDHNVALKVLDELKSQLPAEVLDEELSASSAP